MVSKRLYPRLIRPPRGSFFLFGPRGVGKSTWARQHFDEALRFDLLDEALYLELLADPSQFAGELRRVSPGARVVVDEVQRLPNLLNEVHRFIEERDLRFALLGSSARKLKTAGTNLLAGRAIWKTMFPLVPQELGSDFSLPDVLQFGSIPLVWQSDHRAETLTAYVQLYLREEIKAEALVRNLPGFARFLPIAALFHGQSINVSSIARDCGVARTTVSGYLDILEDTLLTYRLRAYEARLRVRERKLPKLYWVDPGLVRAVKKQLGAPSSEERGALLEGWVLTLLRTYAAERGLFDEIFFWSAAQSNVEVDFLLQKGDRFFALEVKAGSRFNKSMLSGLKAIQNLEGLARRVLLYTGSRQLRTASGIEVWPVEAFLKSLAADRLWP